MCTPWLLIEPKKFSIGSWLKFLKSILLNPSLKRHLQSICNPFIILIQFITEGTCFLVLVSYSILSSTITGFFQNSQCEELTVIAPHRSFLTDGLIVFPLALFNRLSMNKQSCLISSGELNLLNTDWLYIDVNLFILAQLVDWIREQHMKLSSSSFY